MPSSRRDNISHAQASNKFIYLERALEAVAVREYAIQSINRKFFSLERDTSHI